MVWNSWNDIVPGVGLHYHFLIFSPHGVFARTCIIVSLLDADRLPAASRWRTGAGHCHVHLSPPSVRPPRRLCFIFCPQHAGKIRQPKGVCAISARLLFEVQRLRLYSPKEEVEEGGWRWRDDVSRARSFCRGLWKEAKLRWNFTGGVTARANVAAIHFIRSDFYIVR